MPVSWQPRPWLLKENYDVELGRGVLGNGQSLVYGAPNLSWKAHILSYGSKRTCNTTSPIHRSTDYLLPERSDYVYLPDEDGDARARLKIENCEKRGKQSEGVRRSASRQRAMMNGRTGSKAGSKRGRGAKRRQQCSQSIYCKPEETPPLNCYC